MSKQIRLLLIEDDPLRIKRFRSWAGGDAIVVEAKSAGQAMGFLKRLERGELSGLMLDHDLNQQARTSQDLEISGSSLINLVLRYVQQDIPVLVHSMNAAGAASMTVRLEGSGFDVTRIPMDKLTRGAFRAWLDEVIENAAE